MVAIVDALVFISVLSIAAFGLFAYTDCSETEVTMAESISNDLFSMELKACDICDTSDTTVYPISTLIAVCIEENDVHSAEQFLKSTLDSMIPATHGYSLTIEFNDSVISVQRQGADEVSSSYETDHDVEGIGKMRSMLTLF